MFSCRTLAVFLLRELKSTSIHLRNADLVELKRISIHLQITNLVFAQRTEEPLYSFAEH